MRDLCALLLTAVLMSGCSTPDAKTPEADPSRAAVPPAAATETGLSSEFTQAASQARQFIGETLRRGSTHANQAEFDADLATARQKVQTARARATTEADKQVSLILTLLLAKDKERYQTVLLTTTSNVPYESVQSTIQELYASREQCDMELRDWFRGDPASLEALRRGACLGEAQAAAAMVGTSQ